MNDKTIKRWCASGKLPAMAKPYGKTVTYLVSPQALELMALSLQEQTKKKPTKPNKPHIDYLPAWEMAMARGTLTGKAFSPRTIEIYKLYVEHYLAKHLIVSTAALEKELLKIPGKHFAKRDKLWKAILCFGKFLIRQDALENGFIEAMKPLQPKRHLPPKRFTVDEDQLPSLLSACETKQERLIITLLVHTGLRASEACSLKWSDINLEQGLLTVRCGKGGKTRRVGLSLALQAVLLEADQTAILKDELILKDRKGNPMTRNGLYQRVQRIGQAAGLTVSPHALRRAFVTINANKGRPLQMLQKACGHADITTTMSYCLTVEQEVIDAMKGWN